MAIQTFDSDDKAYRAWINRHPNGFVINTPRGRSKNYMVLHRASCYTISPARTNVTEGGYTERAYVKVCADDVRSLRIWVRQYGREDGSFSSECQLCRPE